MFKKGDLVKVVRNKDDEWYDKYIGGVFKVVESFSGWVELNTPNLSECPTTIWDFDEVVLVSKIENVE